MTEPVCPANVLLVDDDAMVARAFARLLQRRGHQVSIAGTAEEATGLLAAQFFDVVVSDIMMPGGGGIAMLRAVRAFDPDMPVILMTGAPTVESAMQAVDSGALKYLMKPLVSGSLETAVEGAASIYRLSRRRREALATSERTESSRTALGRDFAGALDQLWMAYQPIVSWSEQRLFGFEALVRTSAPDFPNPGVFLAAGEKLKLLNTLGQRIRATVATTLSQNPGTTAAFVNLHCQDLDDEALYSPEAPLSAHASRVVLEMSERESMDDVGDLRGRIARLRALGFRIAIDDLGAGYAGFNAIAQVEPDIVKIDMSLVRGVAVERTKRKLIASIVTVCRDLGIQVVAEGIETVTERDALIELGCDLLQGYLLGKPQRSFEAVTWAAANPPASEAAVLLH